MTTIYDVGQLTQRDRLQSCSHVVTGLIEGVEEQQVEKLAAGGRVVTLFRIRVARVEFGSPLPRQVSVRVVGGVSGDISTPWTAPVKLGQKALLVLAPDFGTRPNQFVPCFGGVYPIQPDGKLKIDSKTSEELRAIAGATPKTGITPRLFAIATKAAKVSNPVVTPKPQVREVQLDRVTAPPSEVPVLEIPTAQKTGNTRKQPHRTRTPSRKDL